MVKTHLFRQKGVIKWGHTTTNYPYTLTAGASVTTSLQQEAALQNHNVWKKELVSIIWEDAPYKTLETSKKGHSTTDATKHFDTKA